MTRPTDQQLIDALDLQPHPEGGYFRETYRGELMLPRDTLGPGYTGPRAVGTAIYYLLTADTFSAMHRVRSDEMFHFYLGDPAELLDLTSDGTGRLVTLGANVPTGQTLQHLVRAGNWQGTRLTPGGEYALMGCTVGPGFDFDDFEMASRTTLQAEYPDWAEAIALRTHPEH